MKCLPLAVKHPISESESCSGVACGLSCLVCAGLNDPNRGTLFSTSHVGRVTRRLRDSSDDVILACLEFVTLACDVSAEARDAVTEDKAVLRRLRDLMVKKVRACSIQCTAPLEHTQSSVTCKRSCCSQQEMVAPVSELLNTLLLQHEDSTLDANVQNRVLEEFQHVIPKYWDACADTLRLVLALTDVPGFEVRPIRGEFLPEVVRQHIHTLTHIP